MVMLGDRRVPLSEVAAYEALVAQDAIEFGEFNQKYQQSTFGAHFVEVAVDAATAEVRILRMLAVCAAGCILNPKSARSQVIGAMTMGAPMPPNTTAELNLPEGQHVCHLSPTWASYRRLP